MRSLLAIGAFGIAVASPVAALSLSAATLDIFVADVSIAPLVAIVDVKPETFERRATGVPVTAFVELPAPDDVASIDVRSVRLCRGANPCSGGVPVSGKPKVGDADGDGVRDLKLTFDRGAVGVLVRDVVPPVDVHIAISGLVDGAQFVGGAVVRVVP